MLLHIVLKKIIILIEFRWKIWVNKGQNKIGLNEGIFLFVYLIFTIFYQLPKIRNKREILFFHSKLAKINFFLFIPKKTKNFKQINFCFKMFFLAFFLNFCNLKCFDLVIFRQWVIEKLYSKNYGRKYNFRITVKFDFLFT